MMSSRIQDLYDDSSVLITGGTGFVGKLLISKLLISFPKLRRIYLLLRPKKGATTRERAEHLFNDIIFSKMRTLVPDFGQKVTVVDGDCSEEDLALSKEHRAMLIENVNVIIHGAATVRFNEPLKTAIGINVAATKSIMTLARQMKNLKAYLHISTAYCNCNHQTIDEKCYDFEESYDELIKLAKSEDDEYFESIQSKLLKNRPNTYVFTKAAAEQIISKEGKELPVAIFRPSIILSTVSDPVPGWSDNLYGPTGLVVGCAVGCIKVIPCNKDCISDMVPADMVVNGIIAATWETYKKFEERSIIIDPDNLSPRVYNFVSGNQNPITWYKYSSTLLNVVQSYGLEKGVMYPAFVHLQPNLLLYKLIILFLHFIPAFFFDLYFKYAGKKLRLTKQYQKLEILSQSLSYFATQQWNMRDSNVTKCWESLDERDKEIFPFDIKQVDWDRYLEDYMYGTRKYILKESMDPTKAKCRLQRCYRIYMLMNSVTYAMLACFFVYVLRVVIF